MTREIPSGTVTFMFTDIEGSTKLAQDFPKEASAAIVRHNEILTEIIEMNNGFVFKKIGDSFCAAFHVASKAVIAAVEIQIKLAAENWKNVPIKIRVGINTGAAEWENEDYSGYLTLSKSSRIVSAGHGGQILVSDTSYNLLKSETQKDISFKDLGIKRLKDFIYPVHIYQITNSSLESEFPPIKTDDQSPNNLPAELNSFIGRENELKLLLNEIEEYRLITLLGTGGAGKTRLSIEAGRRLVDNFLNGVWIIELAPVSEPERIPGLIAEVLVMKEEKSKSIKDSLLNFLREKEILLIIDNCEHLINECAVIVSDIVRSAPNVKILVTSRESLNINGEKIHPVPSLSVPESDSFKDINSLSQYESVKLFIDRVLSFQPSFKVTNENAPSVAEICHHLGGMPLALELAAARVRTMSVEKIVEKLENSFKILTGGSRTSMPRQQTLHALIDWSYELLSDNEKLLFARLVVFRGGWDMESAEVICAGVGLEDFEVLDHLTSLVQKSLIESEPDKEKFKMLETIRQYSLEKLNESGESETFLEKHFNYFLKYSEQMKELLKIKNDKEGILKTDKLIDNIRNAIEYALKKNDHKGALKISTSLFDYWYMKGFYSEGKDFMVRSLENTNGAEQKELGIANNMVAFLFYTVGDYESANRYVDISISIVNDLDDKIQIAKCYNTKGIISLDSGDYEKAKECLEISGKIYEERSDKDGLISNYINTGNYWYYKKEYEKTLDYYKKAEVLSKEINDIEGLATIYHNQALINQNLGKPEESIKQLQKSLELRLRSGNKDHIALSYHSIGNLYEELKDHESAEINFKKSLNIYETIGSFSGITDVSYSLGLFYYETKSLKKSEYYHSESLKTALKVSDHSVVTSNLEAFARLFKVEKNFVIASKLLGKSKAIRDNKELIFEAEAESSVDIDIVEKEIIENIGEEKFKENFNKGKEIPAAELVKEFLK